MKNEMISRMAWKNGESKVNAREMQRMIGAREQKVALCVRTFFNLNGKEPDVNELVSWLGNDYLMDIMRYRRMEHGSGAVCA